MRVSQLASGGIFVGKIFKFSMNFSQLKNPPSLCETFIQAKNRFKSTNGKQDRNIFFEKFKSKIN